MGIVDIVEIPKLSIRTVSAHSLMIRLDTPELKLYLCEAGVRVSPSGCGWGLGRVVALPRDNTHISWGSLACRAEPCQFSRL